MIPPICESHVAVVHRLSMAAFMGLLALAISLSGCSKAREEFGDAAPGAEPIWGKETAAASRTESAWIVQSVSNEIVRMAMFAAKAESAAFTGGLVAVTPKGKDGGGYHYAVDVRLPKQAVTHTAIDIPGSIWDPEAYVSFTRDILARLAVKADHESGGIGGRPLLALTDLRAEVIQKENLRVSEWLTAHPLDPEAHEQAALVIGVLGMRENCGIFFDTHDFCNRAAAHLALARVLRADHSIRDAGAVAELLIGLLIDTKQDCERRIEALTARIGAAPELKPWTVAARLRNRRDYRILPHPEGATLIERIELFRATGESAGTAAACKALGGSLREPLPDWTRILLENAFSVDEGHQFTENAMALEFAEAAKIFPEFATAKPSAEGLSKTYNREPGSLVNKGVNGAMKVEVIDDGIWAMFLQRHLCHTLSSIHYFLHHLWGVEDEVENFKTSTSVLFQRLTLFPMVSVDAEDADWVRTETPALKELIETHPGWVPEDIWGRFVRDQHPPGFPRPDTWYTPGLPPGTAYRFQTRVEYIPEVRLASPAEAQRYYDLAPWQYSVAKHLYQVRSGGRPDAAVFKEVLGRFLEYNHRAMQDYAALVKDNPAEYIAVLRHLAEQNPGHYLELGKYLANRHMDKEAVEAYENAIKFQADAVWVSNNCEWLVDYYADHGNVARATEIAKFAAEVYSRTGLETMAFLMERLNKLPEAEDHFQKLAERYNDGRPLSSFYSRQSLKAIGAPAFPAGSRDVSLGDFQGAPKSGVLVQEAGEALRESGVKSSEIIVALDGKRVDSFEDFLSIRALSESDGMDVIVFGEGKYRAVHAETPGRRFNLKFVTYHP